MASCALVLFLASCGSSGHPAATASTTTVSTATTTTTEAVAVTTATEPEATATSIEPGGGSSAPVALELAAFVGTWGSHVGAFTIKADGTGHGVWRVYRWCTDNPTPPCDGLVKNSIIDGGNADIRVTAVHSDIASADVVSTTDAAALPKGVVSITLLPGYRLQVGSLTPFCGPHAQTNACGA